MDDQVLLADRAVGLVDIFTPALGNRLLRALDGRRVINIACFRSVELYDNWRASALFADHLDLVEVVDPALYSPVCESD